MSRLYKTEGIVLKHSYIGEADTVLIVYTPFLGKLRAVARGVKRSKSRLAGHVEPLTHCSMMLAEGRDLDIVSGCQTVDAFMSLRSDLWLLSYGLYAAELTDRLGAEGAENRPLFLLLLNALRSLSGGVDPNLVLRYFELRSVACSGYLPELWKCVSCRHSLKATPNFFSAPAGGVLCSDCGAADRFSRAISPDVIKLLRFFSQNDYSVIKSLKLKANLAKETEELMHGYIACVLDQEVKSARWLRQLRVSEEKKPEGAKKPQ